MKLLLTSAGITNKSIANALADLTQKKFEDLNLVFIPTAANIESGDKDWLIQDLINLKNLKFKSIEITDISAVSKEVWKPSLENADILFFEGGNTYHLMDWIRKTGVEKLLPELLKTKVYVGVSAGSMVACSDLPIKVASQIYEEDHLGIDRLDCLNFVDFYFLPHLDSEYFLRVRNNNEVRNIIKEVKKKTYILDDNSAIKIDNDKLEIITEGNYLELN